MSGAITYYFLNPLGKVFLNVYEILKQNELLNKMCDPVGNHTHLYFVQTDRKVSDQSSISKTKITFNFKVPMKRKFLLHYVKELFRL